jgi:polysaccharide chain length determinant protein (PEP-CTERM system associated)
MDTRNIPNTLSDYLGILRRRRIYLLTVIPGVILASVFIAFTLTPQYRSTATIMLEPASISEELVRTLSSYADQQFELVQRRVLIPSNLEPLIGEIDPYPSDSALSPREKAQRIIDDTIIERVDPITFEVLQQSNAFSIHYHNQDPQRAAEIAKRLSDLFLQYNRQTRSERATAAYDFLLEQSRQVESKIGEVDARVAQFKIKHGEALPEAQVRNLGAAERASQTLFGVEAQIREATERQGLLEVQLSKINPVLGTTTGNTQLELATLQGQLAEARVRYTPDHPDVKRLQRQIEALMAKSAAEPPPTRVVANNPDYLAVQSQVNATRREISALQASAAEARRQLYAYQAGAMAAPRVESDYSALMRERGVLELQFNELQAKLREADISQNLEAEQRGDRFTQIRSPAVADSPHYPNRLGIILLGFVLGSGLAFGLAALAESSDPTVRGLRDVRSITEISAVGSVPVMLGEAELAQQRKHRLAYFGVLALATGLVVFRVATA